MNVRAKIPMPDEAFKPGRKLTNREVRSLGHVIRYDFLDIELTGHAEFASSIRCEVAFYEATPEIPETRDEPGEPAEIEIASVRPYDIRKTGTNGVREYLPCPEWFEEILIDCIDCDRLSEVS